MDIWNLGPVREAENVRGSCLCWEELLGVTVVLCCSSILALAGLLPLVMLPGLESDVHPARIALFDILSPVRIHEESVLSHVGQGPKFEVVLEVMPLFGPSIVVESSRWGPSIVPEVYRIPQFVVCSMNE